ISIRLDDKLARLAVIVTIGDTEVGAVVKALSCGANDFVTKPYNPEIIKRRLLNAINLHENTSFVRATQTDVLTGLYSRSAFLEKARELISAKEAGYYVMAYFDVDNFKVINDRYGNAKGDEVLKLIAKIFGKGFECAGGICSRVAADHFVVLYPKSFIESEKIAEMRSDAEKLDGSIQPITFSIGRYIIDDPSLPVSAMYDRASIAKLAAKKASYDVKIVHYDESMREKILDEQEIVNEMHSALEKEQFEIWLQPQYNHSSGGLSARRRWFAGAIPKRVLFLPENLFPCLKTTASSMRWTSMFGSIPAALSANGSMRKEALCPYP
ncbi:MAG: diguanylate cyclase, partial [Clostridiales bacterium]|nr:diguanylate cyclase [Clostridiales bacterium]